MNNATPWTTTIGNRLRRLRAQREVTQASVAEAIGIATITYRQYERGVVKMSITSLALLCEYYEVQADAILARDALPTRARVPPILSPLAQTIARSLASTPKPLLLVMRQIQRLQPDTLGSKNRALRG